MRVLITGATGKIGSRLARRLALRGDDVRALVREPARASLDAPRIEVVRGDLRDHASLDTAVRGVDAVVHCAAVYFEGASSDDGRAVNDEGTRHLAEAARAAGVARLVFTSTGLVYGTRGGHLASEDDAPAPEPGYFAGKLATEHMLLGMSGLDVCVLRLPFVYGDGDGHLEEFIPRMRRAPPAQRISIGHHADLARAVALVLDAPRLPHQLYDVVADEAPTLAALFAAAGAPPPDGSAGRRVEEVLLDGRRLREELGFRAVYPTLGDALEARAVLTM